MSSSSVLQRAGKPAKIIDWYVIKILFVDWPPDPKTEKKNPFFNAIMKVAYNYIFNENFTFYIEKWTYI